MSVTAPGTLTEGFEDTELAAIQQRTLHTCGTADPVEGCTRK
jgi:hypothetical protein